MNSYVFIKVVISCLSNHSMEEFLMRKHLNYYMENISLFSTTFVVEKHMQKALIFIFYLRILYMDVPGEKILITYLLFIIKLDNQPNTIFFLGFILIHPAVNTN